MTYTQRLQVFFWIAFSVLWFSAGQAFAISLFGDDEPKTNANGERVVNFKRAAFACMDLQTLVALKQAEKSQNEQKIGLYLKSGCFMVERKTEAVFGRAYGQAAQVMATVEDLGLASLPGLRAGERLTLWTPLVNLE